jgi:hypothetical protein
MTTSGARGRIVPGFNAESAEIAETLHFKAREARIATRVGIARLARRDLSAISALSALKPATVLPSERHQA